MDVDAPAADSPPLEMQMKLRARIRLATTSLVLFAMVQPAGAQLDRQWTTAEAVAQAGAVVAARVLSVEVREVVNIYTFVEFETISVAKGSVPPRFTYRMLGGRIGNREIGGGDDMPVFKPGEEVVVFLGPETSLDGLPTMFSNQVYRISTSGAIRTVTTPATGLPALAGRAPTTTGASMRLVDFMNAVRLVK
jgi:hypothetical protein